MRLRLFDIGWQPIDLDVGRIATLPWDIDGNLEARLQLSLGVSATTNERSVLLGRNIENFSGTALQISNNALDRCNDLVYDIICAGDLDEVSVGIGLGELNGLD